MMKIIIFSLLTVLFMGCGEQKSELTLETKTLGFIEVLDSELEEVLDVDAVPEIIGEGFEWSEGPVWVDEPGFLLFSDVPTNIIYRWTERDGINPYLEPSGYTGSAERGGEMGSNGLILSRDGRLLICQHGDRRVARMDAPLDNPAPQFTTLADNYGGLKFNSPNDLVEHSSGSIYFTDPPYGLEGFMNDPAKEIDFQGVYRIDPDGEVTLLTDEVTRPNGLAFSRDETRLYVASSDSRKAIWMIYDVLENGEIENGRGFYDATDYLEEEQGLPDGMKINREGYIFATGPGGVWIFSANGRVLGKIKTGELISNVAFDGDEETLFMTADAYVLRLKLK